MPKTPNTPILYLGNYYSPWRIHDYFITVFIVPNNRYRNSLFHYHDTARNTSRFLSTDFDPRFNSMSNYSTFFHRYSRYSNFIAIFCLFFLFCYLLFPIFIKVSKSLEFANIIKLSDISQDFRIQMHVYSMVSSK